MTKGEGAAMKWVEIDGDTWHYAAKEYRYDVILAYNGVAEQCYDYEHPDYNNSNSYFIDKAFNNYNS